MSSGGRGLFVWFAATVVSVGLALAAVAVVRDSVDGPSLEAIDAALEASPEAAAGDGGSGSATPSPEGTTTPPTDDQPAPTPDETATETDDDGPPTASTTRPSTTSTSSPAPSATSSPSTAPSTGSTPSSSPSPSHDDDDDDDSPTPSPSPSAGAEETVRSATAIGGRASFRVVDGRVELLGATPEPGFAVEIQREADRVEVTFESATHQSQIRAELEDGALDVRVEEESEVDD